MPQISYFLANVYLHLWNCKCRVFFLLKIEIHVGKEVSYTDLSRHAMLMMFMKGEKNGMPSTGHGHLDGDGYDDDKDKDDEGDGDGEV